MLVIDPGSQFLQSTVELLENVPAPQAVQIVAPVPDNVLVIDPGSQVLHEVLDAKSSSYFPAGHATHCVPPVTFILLLESCVS